jgi:hypothetical protein
MFAAVCLLLFRGRVHRDASLWSPDRFGGFILMQARWLIQSVSMQKSETTSNRVCRI